MNIQTGLCPNCIYHGSCAIEASSPTPVFYCEEHFVEARKEMLLSDHTVKPVPVFFENLIGLCATCDYQTDCALRSENQIILNCEHYH